MYSEQPRLVATYDYLDQAGNLAYQTVRYEPKDFKQRQPDGTGGWIWNMKGVILVPFMLPSVLRQWEIDDTHRDRYDWPESEICIVEGEKDALNLWSVGIPATCNVGGAGKWLSSYSEWFRGRRAAIIPDHDPAGIKHAEQVAGSLIMAGVKSVRIIQLAGLTARQDVSDWIAANPNSVHGHKTELLKIIRQSPKWEVS